MLKTLNTTNSIFQIISAEVEAQQQTTTPAPVAQQEATPKYTTKTIKTSKTNKTIKPLIKTTYVSISTKYGYYVPSQDDTIFTHTTHTTTLDLYSKTLGFNLAVKVNGQDQVTASGDDLCADWTLHLVAGNKVEVTVSQMGSDFSEVITLFINENGVVADAPEGIKHRLAGTHNQTKVVHSKYAPKAAPAQAEVTTVEVAPVAQETIAQIEEETAPVAAQEEQVLAFGKHAGKLLSDCETSYLKWLIAHESRVAEANRWACTAAKTILAARQAQQEQTNNTNKTTSTINKITTRKSRVSSSIASRVAAKVAQAENIIATGEFSKSVAQTIERKLGLPVEKATKTVQEVDLGLIGNLASNRGFQILR